MITPPSVGISSGGLKLRLISRGPAAVIEAIARQNCHLLSIECKEEMLELSYTRKRYDTRDKLNVAVS